MNRIRAALASFAVLASAAPCLAHDEEIPKDPHLWAVWASGAAFFAILTVFLVVTHRRTAKETARLDEIERRLNEA